MVLIEPTNPLKLFDIENLVTMEDSDGHPKVIGFIFELVGPITAPLYSIQLYPGFMTALVEKAKATGQTAVQADFMKRELHGKLTCVVKRTLKLINSRLDEIMKKKGCDASNMFDEELMQTELEFSDDEEEKEAKKQRKLQ